MKRSVHCFNTDEAEKYGVHAAIILYNIRFWLEKNKASKSNIRNGYYWTFNSSESFSNLFPYMPASSIRRHLSDLEKAGILRSGNYNKSAWDKTKWYTIVGEFETELSDRNGTQISDLPIAHFNQSSNHTNQSSNHTNQLSNQIGQTIPDITSNVNLDVNIKDTPPTPRGEEIKFPFSSKEFLIAWDNWKVYKKEEHSFKFKSKLSEQAALTKLTNLAKTSDEAITIIMQSIENGWKGFFKIQNDQSHKNKSNESSYGFQYASDSDIQQAFSQYEEKYGSSESQ